jgi:Family of unknown function (DUF5681)
MSDRSDDDALGYKKPPHWSRFRKGKSGNPAGRPPRKDQPDSPIPASTPSDDILRRELQRKHKLKEGGKSIKLSMLEVVTKAQLAAAAKGNPIAQRDVIKRARELEIEDAERQAELERDARETMSLIVNWRKRRVDEWAAAVSQGEEPDEPWPHPDDIIINKSAGTWTLRGPLDEDSLPWFSYLRAERDWHFSALILRLRQARSKSETRIAHALHQFWGVYDAWLPKRWQIADDLLGDVIALLWLFPLKDLLEDVMRFEAVANKLRPEPKPEHRREIYQAANRLMKPLLKPMGYRSLAQFEHAFEQDGENMAWPRGSG